MDSLKYNCPKCQNTQYETGQLRAAGGFWTKVFNVQSKKFTTVTCSNCRYTEMYHADSSKLGNIFDLFVG